jgi:hypothetical protein
MVGSWLLEKRKTIFNSQPGKTQNIKPTCEHVLPDSAKQPDTTKNPERESRGFYAAIAY